MRALDHKRLRLRSDRADHALRALKPRLLKQLELRMHDLKICISKVGDELEQCRRNERRHRLITTTTVYQELVTEFVRTAEAYVRLGSL